MIRFLVGCPYCGRLIDTIAIEDDDWHEAAAWAYIAARGHAPSCPKKRRTV